MTEMSEMGAFFAELLNAVAVFLGSEPVIYLFGLICLALVVKVFRDIMP